MSVRILFLVAAVASSVALSAGPVSSTRFQFDPSGRILLKVRVNGKAHAFVMDTATRHTTVSEAIAATLNGKITESRAGVRTVDDVSLELLGVVMPHQTLRLAREQISDDGIVGAELCRRFVVKVDFRARRITLWPPSETVRTRNAVVVPADFSSDVPIITATVNAPGVPNAAATLAVGLAVAPGTVSFSYPYAAESGLLDAASDGELPIELHRITQASIVADARLPHEPDRTPLVFADGVVSARALTASWIVFDAPRHRIVLGQ